jgi:flagellar hook assembly protein FlgD
MPFSIVTPEDYRLEQNYPNPFNPSTEIGFSLPVDKKISLTVYDMLGREVRTLVNNELYKEGTHRVTWTGTDASNVPVASGMYVATMKYGNYAKSIKMMLVK